MVDSSLAIVNPESTGPTEGKSGCYYLLHTLFVTMQFVLMVKDVLHLLITLK